MNNLTPYDAVPMFLSFCDAYRVRTVELGIYKYTPRCIGDNRRIVRVPMDRFLQRFRKIKNDLAPDEDIAIHSKVAVDRGDKTVTRHVPMIDLSGELSAEGMKSILALAADFGAKKLSVFFSGRSYHVYVYRLLPPDEWLRFMGRCLLLNIPGHPEIVDCRWVGHRLIAGYASLRWTKQSSWYQSQPLFFQGFDFGPTRYQTPKHSLAPIEPSIVQPWLFPPQNVVYTSS